MLLGTVRERYRELEDTGKNLLISLVGVYLFSTWYSLQLEAVVITLGMLIVALSFSILLLLALYFSATVSLSRLRSTLRAVALFGTLSLLVAGAYGISTAEGPATSIGDPIFAITATPFVVGLFYGVPGAAIAGVRTIRRSPRAQSEGDIVESVADEE